MKIDIDTLFQVLFFIVIGIIFIVSKLLELKQTAPKTYLRKKKPLREDMVRRKVKPGAEGIGLEEEISLEMEAPEVVDKRVPIEINRLREGIKWAIILGKPRAIQPWQPVNRR